MVDEFSRRKLSLGERMFVAVARPVTAAMLGFRIPFLEDYIRTWGISEFVKWSNEGLRTIRVLQKRYGDAEAHMLVSMAALWCGCRWCSTAHMYIANLMLFKDDGVLGPIDELSLHLLQEEDDEKVRAELERRLVGRWAYMVPVMHRQYLLRAGSVDPSNDEDDLLLRTNALWEWIVECTIMGFDQDPETIPAWGPGIGRAHELKARYREARRQQRRVEDE